jgi:hypothetical protein
MWASFMSFGTQIRIENYVPLGQPDGGRIQVTSYNETTPQGFGGDGKHTCACPNIEER